MEHKINFGEEEISVRVFKAGDILLTGIKEAAEILGVHTNTVRRWADDGLVPSSKLPSGVRRFPVDGLIEARSRIYGETE